MNDDLLIHHLERKAKLRDVFAATMTTISDNKILEKDTELAKTQARFYSANNCPEYRAEKHRTSITVTNERSFEAAKRLLQEKDGKVAVLNFANSTNPGGGVRGGSGAQEESLCRCSNLYPVLAQDKFRKVYYDENRANGDFRASNDIIYAPDITVFKTDTDYPELMPEKDWYKVDVITCAAPNLFAKTSYFDKTSGTRIEINSDWQTKTHYSRFKQIFRVALDNNARRLVLGAFGCGAFRNDPSCVARGIQLALKEFDGQFEEVVFAIYHQPNELRNYQTFKRVFENDAGDNSEGFSDYKQL